MTVEEQRRLGIKLASKEGAVKTLAVIKDLDSSYEDIFSSAIEELGIEKLAPIILEFKDPNWALFTISNVPNLGAFEEPLHQQALLLPQNATDAEVETSFGEMRKISSFQLDVVAGASYAASFTMYWYNPARGALPQSGYPGRAPFRMSSQIPVGQSTSNPCSFFALPNAPLNANDTVWMVVALCGGGWYSTGFRYTYDPGSTCKAVISAHGGLASPVFNAVVSC